MKVKIKVLQTPNSLDPESRKARCMEYGLEGMVYTMTGEPVDGIVPNRYTVRWLPEGCPLTFVPQNGEPQSITPDADGHFIIPGLGDLHVGGTADLSHTMVRMTYEGDRDDEFEPYGSDEVEIDTCKRSWMEDLVDEIMEED